MFHLSAKRTSLLALCVIVLCGCTSVSGPSLLPSALNPVDRFRFRGLKITKGKPFVIAQSDSYTQRGSVSHPNLMVQSDKRINLAYYAKAGKEHGGQTLAVDWPAYSDDGGKTWNFGDPFIWADGVPHATEGKKGEKLKWYYGYGWGAVRLQDGTFIGQDRVMKFKKNVMQAENRGIWSSDGEIWFGPRKIQFQLPPGVKQVVCISPRGVLLPDGSHLIAAYYVYDYPDPHPKVKMDSMTDYVSSVFISADGGQSYSYYSDIAKTPDKVAEGLGPCEPDIIRLKNGDILSAMRSQWKIHRPIIMSRSVDDGKTWQREDFREPGVMPMFVETENGILMMAYGRPGNNLLFSLDNGKTWGRKTIISSADEKTSGYITAVEVEPNRVLIVYDSYGKPSKDFWLWEPPPDVNTLWGMFIDIEYEGEAQDSSPENQ
ncbi:MAG: glycoside hydrolase [Verrucomicrobia bacterium]|nr:glycoside hydrolase [Verrucomicrobiota bacterium]